jgi:hypothetical protein
LTQSGERPEQYASLPLRDNALAAELAGVAKDQRGILSLDVFI